jgi:hypothetical protein
VQTVRKLVARLLVAVPVLLSPFTPVENQASRLLNLLRVSLWRHGGGERHERRSASQPII